MKWYLLRSLWVAQIATRSLLLNLNGAHTVEQHYVIIPASIAGRPCDRGIRFALTVEHQLSYNGSQVPIPIEIARR